jgi:hypothetical protein
MATKGKAKNIEPSLRDKLSASFMKAFENDFQLYGVEAIEQLREKHPDQYARLAAQLIATTEPKPDGIDFKASNSMREIGLRLLQSVGVNEFEITEKMIEEAIEENDAFIAKLAAIRAKAEGEIH